MKTLHAYLSTLTTEQQDAFAKAAGTSIGYLRKALSTHPRMDGALCRRLDELSKGAVKRSDLRPDIWPEEVGKPAKKRARS